MRQAFLRKGITMRSDREMLEQQIQRLVREEVAIVPYNPAWPKSFYQEKEHLLSCLPKDLIGRRTRRARHSSSSR